MGTAIYLIGDNEQLTELVQQPYESEGLLQQLLAKYPSVLAGDQVDPTAPRRWMLISQEVPVPFDEEGPGNWYLDHLFVDQDAVPTLVEVKRKSDYRIRREVVGQMLDYAANAVLHWPVEKLQAYFARRCEIANVDPSEELIAFLGSEGDPDAFWHSVKTSLQAGKIRLVFVADKIPAGLGRIVEFLNQQMDPAQVLAIEIRQYAGGGLRSLVPRLIGQTEQAKQRKGTSAQPARKWTEDAFFTELQTRCGDAETSVARRLLDWARQGGALTDFGSGTRFGSIFVGFAQSGQRIWPIALWTYGKLEIQFQGLRTTEAFRSIESRRELADRLNRIPGVSIADDQLEKRPSIPFASLADPEAERRLLEALDWSVHHIRAS